MVKNVTLGIIVVIAVAVVAVGSYVVMQPAPTTTTTTAPTTTTTTTTTPTWQDKLSELKLGVIYTSPLDEPWGMSLHIAIEAFQEQYGNFAAYDYTEAVYIGDEERVLRGYADSGHQLIIAHSYYPAVPTLTTEYTDIPFVGSGGGMEPIWLYPEGIADPNYIHTQPLSQYMTYIQGEVAGRLTETNKIGIVGNFPVWNVNNTYNSFLVGLKNSNPDAQISIVWIESWWDPVAAKSAAESLIATGADVIFTSVTGPEAAAEEAGVYHLAWEQEYPTGVSDDATVGWGSWNLSPFVYDYIYHWANEDIMDWIEEINHEAYYNRFVAAAPHWQFEKFGVSADIVDLVDSLTEAINNEEITIQPLGGIPPEEAWELLTPELIQDILGGVSVWP